MNDRGSHEHRPLEPCFQVLASKRATVSGGIPYAAKQGNFAGHRPPRKRSAPSFRRSKTLYGALEVKRKFHDMLFFLHPNFFVRVRRETGKK